MSRKTIGITMGDPAGIGAEITVKALNSKRVYEKSIPVVIGDYEALQDALNFCNLKLKLREIKNVSEALGEFGTIDYINLNYLKKGSWEYKKPQKLCGDASFNYVTYAIKLAKKGEIEAVITAPINKEAINMAGHNYSGHTEIFADYTGIKKYAMLLASGNLRVIHVSTHCSLRQACDNVKKERVLEVIKLANEGLELLGVNSPVIGVAGLNPHCSENGLFGWEEEKEIIPAIEEAKKSGLNVIGPEPPDTVFVKCMGGMYDIVVAMYHDQGHIPLKLSGFKLNPSTNSYTSMSGINCTIGLPVIRASVDHGTAYGKAGEGRANEESMLDAIFAGITMAKNKFGGQ
ncbi:MAG: 4-hydroxythreonine-4-phosphate dehydrogenase PdxA [Clostridia bacterium]|nr:4-hydroxythreonine-4-phosphate dehydrogenase PdxA [Clostridia bacterium]